MPVLHVAFQEGFANDVVTARVDGVEVFSRHGVTTKQQIGYADSRDGDPGNDAAVATMFNLILSGGGQATPALDDEVSISTLYPTPTFATDFGKITGHVFLQDGTTPFQDAFVIARKVGDPRLTAVGIVSGARYYAGHPDAPPALQGLFELPGLPPGSYTVEVEEVHFQSFSHIGPVFPVPKLPGPPEFWNGANEAATNPPDDPAAFELVGVSAGATSGGIDVVLNDRPVNDDCVDAKEVDPFLFGDFVNTTRATTEPSDPLQSCGVGGPSQNARSVWYRLTPPTDGVIFRADTSATDYPTVMTLHTGSCGSLTEETCAATGGEPSYINAFPVVGGTTYLFEVTAATPDGGSLAFSSQFFPANPVCRGGVSIGQGLAMAVAGIGPPAGDERLIVRGRLLFAPGAPAAFDPATTGVQVLVESIPTYASPFAVFDLTHRTTPIPGGGPGTGCAPTDGWRAVGTSLVYTNRSNALPPTCQPGTANGLVRLKLKDRRALGRGIYFQMRTRSSIVPSPTTLVRVTVVLGGTAASGLEGSCAERLLSDLACAFSSNGSRFECR